MILSMYSGVSGLKAQQTKLNVIGNNISNISTTGYKSQSTSFSDTLSQTIKGSTASTSTLGGTNAQQVGLGSSVASIATNMTTGSTQSTGVSTDVAITGSGFFILQGGSSGDYQFTRDGGFDVDADGNLTMDGYKVCGWMDYTQNTDGTVTYNTQKTVETLNLFSDIYNGNKQIIDPEVTTGVTFSGNLDSTATTQGTDLTHIGTAVYTATQSSTIAVYDALGNAYDTTVSYTKCATATSAALTVALSAGTTLTAITTTMTLLAPATVGTSGATIGTATYTAGSILPIGTTLSVGSLSAGSISLTSITGGAVNSAGTTAIAATSISSASQTTGSITLIAAATVGTAGATIGTTTYSAGATISAGTTIASGEPSAGSITFGSATVSGASEAASITTTASVTYPVTSYYVTTSGGSTATISGNSEYYMLFDATGAYVGWALPGSTSFSNTTPPSVTITPTTNTSASAFNVSYSLANIKTSTSVSGSTVTGVKDDGYASGELEDVSISDSGIINGTYSNGQTKTLGMLALATFANPEGLDKIGSNLYAVSVNSGSFTGGVAAGSAGTGALSGGTLELSNVDLAEQFSEMMITQRAYEANSKIITASNEILQTVIGMVR